MNLKAISLISALALLFVSGAESADDVNELTLAGQLGIYNNQIVMKLNIAGNSVTGSYFYARHGKDLSLEGTIQPDTGKGTLTESFNGEKTGYFDFTLIDGGMTGTWHAASSNSESRFTFKSLDLSEATFEDSGARLSGFYCVLFENWVYVDGETADSLPVKERYTAWNWLRIRYVGGDVFSFYLKVQGSNAHQGSIQGLARMVSPSKAEFTSTEMFQGKPTAKLGFSVEGDKVTVSELEDCSYHRGARASFDTELKRADEHNVKL